MTLAERVVLAYLRQAGVVRPPRFLDTTKMAQELERFEFVLQFTAWKCRDRKGRALVGGKQVRKLTTGEWQVGYPDVGGADGAWEPPASAAKVYDVIRRSPLNEYVQEAEQLRIYILN